MPPVSHMISTFASFGVAFIFAAALTIRSSVNSNSRLVKLVRQRADTRLSREHGRRR
jgi:hypothetical protein